MKKNFLLACALAVILTGCAKKPVPPLVTVSLATTTTVTTTTTVAATETATTTTAETTTAVPEPLYPQEDEAGRLRYAVTVNGEAPAWELLPFSREDRPGYFFPLAALLGDWQLPYQTEPTSQLLRASVNGQILLLQGGVSAWEFDGYRYDASVSPLWVDETLYVPQYLLEEVFGAEIEEADGVLRLVSAFRAQPDETFEEVSLPACTFGDGNAELVILGDPLAAAVRIYRAGALAPDQQIMSARVDKGGELTLHLGPGEYVVKSALGAQWQSADGAFGPTGYYRSAAVTLKKGQTVSLADLEQTDDTLAGFNGR